MSSLVYEADLFNANFYVFLINEYPLSLTTRSTVSKFSGVAVLNVWVSILILNCPGITIVLLLLSKPQEF